VARKLPLFAVGKATAKEARALGFETVVTGAGTVNELVTHIVSVADPAEGLLLHLAGDRLAGDLKGELEAQGFRVLQPVVYRTAAVSSFSEDTVAQLASGEIDGVILLSPRTATIYAGLMAKHGLVAVARGLAHFCLSEAVAKRLAPLGPIEGAIAEAPKLEEILALIEEAATQFDG
jgi:uroporphyrinogen-III synthase